MVKIGLRELVKSTVTLFTAPAPITAFRAFLIVVPSAGVPVYGISAVAANEGCFNVNCVWVGGNGPVAGPAVAPIIWKVCTSFDKPYASVGVGWPANDS